MSTVDYQDSPPRAPSAAKQSTLVKLLREPLLHFLLLGAALFVIFGLIGKVTGTEKVTVTAEDIQKLIKGFEYDNKRSPMPQEVDKLIDDEVRTEILSREAVKE